MRATLVVVVSVMIAASLCGTVVAGSLDSPGVPSLGSGMHTLSQVYDYLNSGAKAAVPDSFQEPAGMPGSTMKTLEEIYQNMMAKFDRCDITAENVESGKRFFSTQPGSWGVQTGILSVLPRPTATPTSTPTSTPTPTWSLSEYNCNYLSGGGWNWLNGACWSRSIADDVSWNKGVGNDTSKTGTYICNSGGTLESRMKAAVAGRWSEIVTQLNPRNGHNYCQEDNATCVDTIADGATGKPYISALAISDCVDGTRDIGPAITGSPTDDWQGRSAVLKTWATAPGHSALSAMDYDGTNNEYAVACAEAGDAFYENQSDLSPGSNFSWAAALGQPNGSNWDGIARRCGKGDACTTNCCSSNDGQWSSGGSPSHSFRVVARP
ncbi:MAG: hypothetical protein NTZ78_14705 [Candidatus Aureabacteria bacterium]|nr:hypothetical protein [Candidatus Auribacterota bacterium]